MLNALKDLNSNENCVKKVANIDSRLSRGLDTRFSLVGPTKVKACKSFMFT